MRMRWLHLRDIFSALTLCGGMLPAAGTAKEAEGPYIPKARSVPDLVSELESRGESGANFTSWHLGTAQTLRLMDAVLREKHARSTNEAPSNEKAWLAKILIAGEDSLGMAALAGEFELAEAIGSLEGLPNREKAGPFASALLEWQARAGLSQGFRCLAELRKLRLVDEGREDLTANPVPQPTAILSIMENAPKQDPLITLKQLESKEIQSADAVLYATAWFQFLDRAQALSLAQEIRKPGHPAEMVSALVRSISKIDPGLALIAANTQALALEERLELEEQFLSQWIERSPGDALPWIYEHGTELTKPRDRHAVLIHWINAAPALLVDAMEKHPAGKERDEEIEFILREGAVPLKTPEDEADENSSSVFAERVRSERIELSLMNGGMYRHFDRQQLDRLIRAISDPTARQKAEQQLTEKP